MTRARTSSAEGLVRKARSRAARHALARALARGVAAGALVAALAVFTVRLFGGRPGAWLLAALLPVVAVTLRNWLASRPTLAGAALLLDRAAGTHERFVTALSAEDPEVRALVERQALESPAVRDGRFPLTFAPSTEGLFAVLSLALLAAVLLLLPEPEGGGGPTGGGTGPTAFGAPDPVDRPPTDSGQPPAVPTPATGFDARDAERRLASGEGLSEDEWERLESRGLSGEDRDAVEAALAEGDGAGAAAALRKAMADLPDLPPGSGASLTAWGSYETSLRSPEWSPRFDRVVQEYFRRSAEQGLR